MLTTAGTNNTCDNNRHLKCRTSFPPKATRKQILETKPNPSLASSLQQHNHPMPHVTSITYLTPHSSRGLDPSWMPPCRTSESPLPLAGRWGRKRCWCVVVICNCTWMKVKRTCSKLEREKILVD